MIDPSIIDLPNGHDVEIVPAILSLLPDKDQPGPLEHPQVLHHGTAVEIAKIRTQVACRLRFIAEQVEQLSAPAVGKSFEDQIIGIPS